MTSHLAMDGLYFVIPAEAGIQVSPSPVDARFRGHDDPVVCPVLGQVLTSVPQNSELRTR
ncbi:MAG: hypothetical protein M1582_04690 [Actinobacteria bacterium]|nr:hypothetical protein [Actinomycetota bacterium]